MCVIWSHLVCITALPAKAPSLGNETFANQKTKPRVFQGPLIFMDQGPLIFIPVVMCSVWYLKVVHPCNRALLLVPTLPWNNGVKRLLRRIQK